jgi:UDPglucose 6-dehydrogenase
MGEARKVISDPRVTFAATDLEATQGADALVIVTEWKSFRSPAFEVLRTNLKQAVVFDGRNLYDPPAMHAHGFEYHPIGR